MSTPTHTPATDSSPVPEVPDRDVATALVLAAETDPSLTVYGVIVGLVSPEQAGRVAPIVKAALDHLHGDGDDTEDEDGEPVDLAELRPTDPEGGPWMTVTEAAQRVGVSEQTIRRAMRAGLRHVERPHGRPKYRLRAADVDHYFRPRDR